MLLGLGRFCCSSVVVITFNFYSHYAALLSYTCLLSSSQRLILRSAQPAHSTLAYGLVCMPFRVDLLYYITPFLTVRCDSVMRQHRRLVRRDPSCSPYWSACFCARLFQGVLPHTSPLAVALFDGHRADPLHAWRLNSLASPQPQRLHTQNSPPFTVADCFAATVRPYPNITSQTSSS